MRSSSFGGGGLVASFCQDRELSNVFVWEHGSDLGDLRMTLRDGGGGDD